MQQKIGVRFKIGAKVYSFLAEDINVNKGDKVIVETAIGVSLGNVETIENYDPTKENRELKKVLRVATKEDETQYKKMLEKEKLAIKETKSLAEKLKLDMNVVNAEFSLDGSKVVIDFIAEDRIDFRDLVKELASNLKSRIELRQIGIRDQAKMVGGIGICGRVCCCASHLKDFEKVSIKMAKSQGLALNPTKISGSCGRLMCCLAYEDNYYSEVYPKIPKLNKEVTTPDGVGVVVYTNALKQIASVKITSKDGSFVIKDYSLDSLKQEVSSPSSSSMQDYKNNQEKNKTLKNDINLENSKNNQDKPNNKNSSNNENFKPKNNNPNNNSQNNNKQINKDTNLENNNKKSEDNKTQAKNHHNNFKFHKKHKFNKNANQNKPH